MELKPCPFCGGEAHFMVRDDENDFAYDIRCESVTCYLCDGADWWWGKGEVASMWNTRYKESDAT